MSDQLFSTSRVKLARANKFISELDAEFKKYIASKPITGKFDGETNPPSIAITWAAMSDEIGAILGDAIHNVRTALDLMASELVRLAGKSDGNVYFPFSDKEENFDEAIQGRNFHKAGQDAVDLLKILKPYRGGNDDLRSLHDLDINDKHKALIVVGRAMNIDVAGHYDIDDIKNGNVAITKADIDLIFPEGPFKDRPVLDTLKNLVKMVDEILEAFARLVRSRKT